MSPPDDPHLTALPPAVARLERWRLVACWICLATFVAVCGLLSIYALMDDGLPDLAPLLQVSLALLALCIARWWWGMARIRRAVKASAGRACTACIYDLNGLPATGTCPECGHAFDTIADRALWARAKMLK